MPLVDYLLARTRAMSPEDPSAVFVLSQISLRSGNCIEATDHLREALRLGVPPQAVEQLIDVARQQKLDCPELIELLGSPPRQDEEPPIRPSAPTPVVAPADDPNSE